MIGWRCRVNWPALVLGVFSLSLFLPLTVLSSQKDQQLPQTNDVKTLFKQARKEDRKWRFDNAEKLYRRIIELDPKFSDAKLALAYLLAKKHFVRDAYDMSFAIAQAEPTNARAFAVVGATLLI